MTSVDHAGSGTRPICFAGIRTQWTSVRKVKEGETTNDLFAERNVAVELTKGFLNSARSIDVGRKAYGCRDTPQAPHLLEIARMVRILRSLLRERSLLIRFPNPIFGKQVIYRSRVSY
jgi:hypothetical protein